MEETSKKPKPRETSTIRPYLSMELRDKLVDRFSHLAGLSDRAIFEATAMFYLGFHPVQPIQPISTDIQQTPPVKPTSQRQEQHHESIDRSQPGNTPTGEPSNAGAVADEFTDDDD